MYTNSPKSGHSRPSRGSHRVDFGRIEKGRTIGRLRQDEERYQRLGFGRPLKVRSVCFCDQIWLDLYGKSGHKMRKSGHPNSLFFRRSAETVNFPVKKTDLRLPTSSDYVQGFKPKTALENEVLSLLYGVKVERSNQI